MSLSSLILLYHILFGFCIFVFGLCIGSFMNVVIIRGKGCLRGRSSCMSCGHTLGALDLIPVLSFVCLKGKCRYCGTKFSSFYAYGELEFGLTFLFGYVIFTLLDLSVFLCILIESIVFVMYIITLGIKKSLLAFFIVSVIWLFVSFLFSLSFLFCIQFLLFAGFTDELVYLIGYHFTLSATIHGFGKKESVLMYE